MDLETRWYAPLIGYGFSVFAAAILVNSLVETLWKCVASDESEKERVFGYGWPNVILSRVEGVLYVAFLQMGLGSLIGVWLLLKTGGQWQRWVEKGDEASKRSPGWVALTVFLVGNALTVIYAFVGFELMIWLHAGEAKRAVLMMLLVIAATIGFWAWISTQRRSPLG